MNQRTEIPKAGDSVLVSRRTAPILVLPIVTPLTFDEEARLFEVSLELKGDGYNKTQLRAWVARRTPDTPPADSQPEPPRWHVVEPPPSNA